MSHSRLGSIVLSASLVALTACSSGGTFPAGPSRAQASAKAVPSFEELRASVERAARNAAPPGFEVTVNSAFYSKDGRLAFAADSVAMETPTWIGFFIGRKSLVFRKGDLVEVPGAHIVTSPKNGRATSVFIICTDTCQPPPDPIDPPPPPQLPSGETGYFSSVTDLASSIAAQRREPCSQSFTATDSAKDATLTYSTANVNTWTLQYRPGFPSYIGLDTEQEVLAVSQVDGHTDELVLSATVSTGSPHQVALTFGGPLTAVKFAQFAVTDFALDSTNTITALAAVTCANDTGIPKFWSNPVPPILL